MGVPFESQRQAIELIYFDRRAWPASTPKPRFEAVVSRSALERKVTAYLERGAALADVYHRPITERQIDAELARMKRDTQDRETPADLSWALKDDAGGCGGAALCHPHVGRPESFLPPHVVDRLGRGTGRRCRRIEGLRSPDPT